MNATSDHDEVSAMLPAAALDALEAAERRAVEEHVAVCASCRALLDEYREAGALLAQVAPLVPMPPERASAVKARLLLRAASDPTRHRVIRSRAPRRSLAHFAGWAVAAGLAGVLFIHHGIHGPLGSGWIGAGLVTLVAVVLAFYAALQRRTARALRAQLAAHEDGPDFVEGRTPRRDAHVERDRGG